MTSPLLRPALVVALAMPAGPAVAVPVETADIERIQALLASKTPCCVIDARAAAARRKLRIAHALAYRRGMRINPTGIIVVIADTDAGAQMVGETIARTSPGAQIVAVKGGARTWLDARQPAGSRVPGHAQRFVIPSNTCEQGPPLQSLPFGRP